MSTSRTSKVSEASPASRAALVELSDISKYYGNVKALDGVSLEVRAGEITCVLGDNGAGKSTLIKIVAGLHQHDGGTFAIEGRRPGWAPRARPSTAGSPRSTRTSPWSR
ncbi:hypothetical protein SVIO_081090 [Streptomyces violaceusniger]|uniref:ABC transporter domain-containing protein n=1 Tax=Streptomyces violaceusniger TaxID=68280 RepID=A0A4D4LE30_STRVO|nr:hypothetical protein SVIO_081090 [Streptomyces violaceusniger]